MRNELQHEAIVFARYLGAKEISPSLALRYCKAVETLQLALTEKETALLKRSTRFTFLLPFVDGGLVLISPKHGIRKRLLVMFALMETDTSYADMFLTKNDQRFALIRFFYRGGIAVLKGLAGACLLKCLRWS